MKKMTENSIKKIENETMFKIELEIESDAALC